MKAVNTIFLFALAFLDGCHWGDPRPPHLQSDLSVVDNKVCISISPEGDEKIVDLEIYDGNTGEMLLKKWGIAIVPVAGKCVPDFGYAFEMSQPYHFVIITESESRKQRGDARFTRLFETSFTLHDNRGRLEFTAW